MNKEREDISEFLDLDGSRFAKTVTCLGLDAYQYWCISTLTGLQARCKFEGMTWHDTIVMVGRNDERGGIGSPRF